MSNVTASQRLLKQPAEVRKFSMDFANVLETGETLSTSGIYPSVTSQTVDGNTSDLTIYNTAINGTKIEFWISEGTDGRSYRVEVQVLTSGEQIIEGDGILRVTDR
jgi:hypothetical protein